MQKTKRKKVKKSFAAQEASALATAIRSDAADAVVGHRKMDDLKGMLADEKRLKQVQDSQMALSAIQVGDVDAIMVGDQVFTLKDTNHAYRKIVEQMQEGSLTVSDGKIVYCNQYFATMVGRTVKQVIGTRLMDYVEAADRKQLEELNKECHSKKSRARIHFLSKGEKVAAYVSAVLLAVKGLETFCYVVTDLTLQARHEEVKGQLKKKTSVLEKIRGLNEDLMISEQKLEGSSHELILANRKLKKLDEAKTMFMAMASHDLKNPLHIVKSYIDLLMETPAPSPQEAKEYLTYIKESTGRMQQLISSLFDISKIDLGKMPMNLNAKVSLNQILRNCLSAHMFMAQKKSILIKEDLNDDLVEVYGDEDRLYQVFDNLFSNALKYTPRGGQIDVQTKNSSNNIEVTVEDNGIGMDELDLDRIFEPFQHLQSSGLEGEVSTGLGLTVVKKIVEAHGGTIEVRSEKGKGSTFTVSLPKELKPNAS